MSDYIEDLRVIRTMTRGVYDLQKLRIQTGLRLCANFRSKLGLIKAPAEPDAEPEPESEKDEEAKKLIELLKEEYGRLTEGVVAKRNEMPDKTKFTGGELISSFIEFQLVHQYIGVEKQERLAFRQLGDALERLPIWTEYLSKVVGVGPATAAVLVTYFDIEHAHHPSLFWAYAGLDVGPDGYGRSRREEHLIDREYKAKDGSIKTRRSVTYEPWLKARLYGALGTSFMRKVDSPWRLVYDGYKHRLLTDPRKRKVTLIEYKRMHKAKDPETKDVWPPRRVHLASMRYMIKMFLADFWHHWRELEGLPLNYGTYAEGKLGMTHGSWKENLERMQTKFPDAAE